MQRLQRIAQQLAPLRRLHQQRPLHSRAMASAPTAAIAGGAAPLGKLKVACIQMTSGEDMSANISACSELIRQAARAGARFVCTPENTGRMSALTQRAAPTPAPAAADPIPDSSAAAATPAAAPARPASPSSSPPFSAHPVITALSALASELDIWILVGSIAVRADASAAAPGEAVDKRFCNRSVLLAPRSCAVDSTRPELAEGVNSGSNSGSGSSAATAPSQVVASYDKIYLFDVPSLNGAETYLESARVRPGNEAVVADCSGMSQDALGEGVVIGMSVCYGQKDEN